MHNSKFYNMPVIKGSDQSKIGTISYETAKGNQVGVNNLEKSQQKSSPQITQFHKDLFLYSAPHSELDDSETTQRNTNVTKKKLRVLFIKSPEYSALENAALQLAQDAANQRTVIYVLSKQSDLSDLANKFSNLRTNGNSKPEVRFVKYRTQADAENAQRYISAQYDKLPGNSLSLVKGKANVFNFASKGFIPLLPGDTSSSASGGSSSSTSESHFNPQISHLPTNIR